MAQEFNSPFSPFGAPQPEEELLYPEQGMRFGGTGNTLLGTDPTDSGVDPTVLAGLGLGGGIVAAGTGGQAATSKVLSPFAQKVAAQDAARLAAQNRPLLIGQPTTTQGVLVPETRLTQQTQLTNPKQLPAVRATGGAPAPTGQIVPSGGSAKPSIKMAEKVGQAGLPGTAGSGSAGKLRFPGASTISKLLSTGASFLFPESLGDSTISGAYDRLMEAGDVERAEALGYTDPSTEMFNAAYQEMLARKNIPQMSRLSDDPPTLTAPEVRAGKSQQRQGELDRREPAPTTAADGGGFFEPGGFGYEYLGGRLGETIGQFLGEQKYGTGLDVEGAATGRPLNPRGLPGQTATLGASALELLSDYGIDPVVTAAKVVPEYVTGLDLTDSSLIETPTAKKPEAQTAIPEIPQGAPGSPQAFFEEYRSKGPLTPEQISRGEAAAARMGRTFDPDTGFSQASVQADPAAPVTSGLVTQSGIPLSEFLSGAAIPSAGLRAESPMYADNSVSRGLTGDAGRAAYEAASADREARIAARMQQPGETITERDTRLARGRTQSSVNVPTDVREAMLTPEGRRTAKQINRLARWSGSTQGQEMGGVAGLEQSLQPVDAQQQQYEAMRRYKLGLEIDKMQKQKPSEYRKAAAGVDEAIAAGSIKPEDRNKFILRDLGWQAKEGEDSSAFVEFIQGKGAESGIPQSAIDALIADPSRAPEFDKYFGAGSSAKFL